jgi:hypothetical protein
LADKEKVPEENELLSINEEEYKIFYDKYS